MSPLELSECALWIEGPTWLTEDEESENDEFNNEQLPLECLEEMKAGDKEKWKVETSSSLLVTAEATGIAKIMKCEDYSELQQLLRVTGLVLKFVKIMKSRLQKNVQAQEELTSQDIAAAETLWIKEIQRSLSKNPKFEIWRHQFGLFTDEHGIVRCMGRLSQTQLPSSKKMLSQDVMAVSEELLFELKPREEEPLRSDVQCSAFTPWRSSARMMSQNLQ